MITLNAEWKGSLNYGCMERGTSGRAGFRPQAIVLHVMQGSINATDAWFAGAASQVSAHFGIAKDGNIHQYVAVADTAWANGVLEKPDLSIGWLAQCVAKGINPNLVTVSIELEGESGDVVPDAQYAALLATVRYVSQTFAIPCDRSHIIGHYQITSLSRAHCPGTGIDFARLLSDLNPPMPDPTTAANGHRVNPGALSNIIAGGRKAITGSVNSGDGYEFTASVDAAGHIFVTIAGPGHDGKPAVYTAGPAT